MMRVLPGLRQAPWPFVITATVVTMTLWALAMPRGTDGAASYTAWLPEPLGRPTAWSRLTRQPPRRAPLWVGSSRSTRTRGMRDPLRVGPESEDLALLLADAEAGLVEAQWALGSALREEAEREENDCGEIEWKEAAHWLGRAAEQGDARAQLDIGLLSLRGVGVVKDAPAAAAWVSAAANQGLPAAQFQMGLMLFTGVGVPPNPEWARYWLEQAAEQDAPCATDAQCLLGEMFQFGQGVAPCREKALFWFQRALNSGSHKARMAYQAILRQGLGKKAAGNTPRLPGEIRKELYGSSW